MKTARFLKMDMNLEKGQTAIVFNEAGSFKLVRDTESPDNLPDPTDFGFQIATGIMFSLRDDTSFAPQMANVSIQEFENYVKEKEEEENSDG